MHYVIEAAISLRNDVTGLPLKLDVILVGHGTSQNDVKRVQADGAKHLHGCTSLRMLLHLSLIHTSHVKHCKDNSPCYPGTIYYMITYVLCGHYLSLTL